MQAESPRRLTLDVQELTPSAPLRPFVRCFHYTDMDLAGSHLHMPILAGSDTLLQFSVGEPFTVRDNATGSRFCAPRTVVVGRQTRRNYDLIASGRLILLTVHFEPTGFHRLFHLPMTHLTDAAPDAAAVLGSAIQGVHDGVSAAPGRGEMVSCVEAFLESHVDNSLPHHPAAEAAAGIVRGTGAPDVRGMAAELDLSTRQLQRSFLEQLGVSPRLFRRIVRFERALQTKHRQPARSWADVASDNDYFDQMHLVRDCHQLGGGAPSDLIRQWVDCEPPPSRPQPGGSAARQARAMSLTY